MNAFRTRQSHPDRHQLLRRLPELPVDEIGGEAAHERELFGLPRPDLQGARPQGRKGLLHQLFGRDQSDSPPSGRSPVRSVFTAGGMSSMTSTPVSSNWNRSDWV